MLTPKRPSKIEMKLVGPFELCGHSGEDIRPKLRKSRAILAVLALSRKLRRPRSWLQNLLWGEREEKFGADSFRQSLTDIRRSLGRYRDCLIKEGDFVRLDPDLIDIDVDLWCDVNHSPLIPEIPSLNLNLDIYENLPGLLTGFDITEPEFDDWLRDERSRFEDNLHKVIDAYHENPVPPTQTMAGDKETATTPAYPDLILPPTEAPFKLSEDYLAECHIIRPWIRIIPPQTTSQEGDLFLSKFLTANISQNICDMVDAEIRMTADTGPGIDLRIEINSSDTTRIAIASITHGHAGHDLWQGTRSLPLDLENHLENPSTTLWMNQIIDIIILEFKKLAYPDPTDSEKTHLQSSQSQDATPFAMQVQAIHKMFQFSQQNLYEADTLLEKAYDQHPNGVTLAWQAYLQTFYVAEYGRNAHTIDDQVRELISKAIELAPNNSYVLALSSYVHSFILREPDVGGVLAEKGLEFSASNPMALAYYGFAKTVQGDRLKGYEILKKAQLQSGQSPYRYTIDFLTAVAATLAHKFDEAILLYNTVRAKKPNYKPAYRYLTVLNFQKGDFDRAREVMTSLQKLEPDFSFRKLLEPNYPVTAMHKSNLLSNIDKDFI